MRDCLERRNLKEERFSLAKVQGNTVQKVVMAAEVRQLITYVHRQDTIINRSAQLSSSFFFSLTPCPME